jgi:hypothetical protein
MGILDEAIREHLELKRQHGAGEGELKKLEDQAFGQAERPGAEASDTMAEAPTEFMARPDAPEESATRREPTIADLQEPPPPPMPEPAPNEEELPAAEEPESAGAEAEIAEPAGPSTEERQVIAEQPTELFDVPEEIASAPAPSDEELADEEATEPRLGPAEPLADLEEDEAAEVTIQRPAPDDDEDYEDEDDAFWNEQRLSDELDQALEGPSDAGPLVVEEPDSTEEVLPIPEERESAPPEEEAAEPESAQDDEPEPAAPRGHDDVLDETPDFLEEAPEDDQLWFEQKPPKDFDFDD